MGSRGLSQGAVELPFSLLRPVRNPYAKKSELIKGFKKGIILGMIIGVMKGDTQSVH